MLPTLVALISFSAVLPPPPAIAPLGPRQRSLHRYYDPRTGRWISRDPIGFAGGSVNLYQYCGNDPVNRTDPTGLADNPLLQNSWFHPSGQSLADAVSESYENGTMLRDVAHIPARLDRQFTADVTGLSSVVGQLQHRLIKSVLGMNDAEADGLMIGLSIYLPQVRLPEFSFRRHGPGPVANTIEIGSRTTSSGAFKEAARVNGFPGARWSERVRGSRAVEYVFDPDTERMLIGTKIPGSGSPHQRLGDALGLKSRRRLVGGEIWSRNGRVIVNTNSGHYWQNWTPTLREQFTAFLQRYAGEFDWHD